MNKLILICTLFIAGLSNAQTVYLSEIKTKNDFRYPDNSINIPINYWRFDTCLYSPAKICKYNTSTAANIKIIQYQDYVRYIFARSNNSGYKSKHNDDSLTYYLYPGNNDSAYFVRKIWIDRGSDIKADIYQFRTDTFGLKVTDTIYFGDNHILHNVFGKTRPGKMPLRIFVLKSVDTNGSVMLHYWAENIGIVKLTDEKCWRYSFEMMDDRTKSIEKMFGKIMRLIKSKYEDPQWGSEPCHFE